MLYEIEITKKVMVNAHNIPTAIYLATKAVEEGLPLEGVESITDKMPLAVWAGK
jgi:hypothetical protein